MKDAFAVETSAPTSSPVGPSDAASVGKGSISSVASVTPWNHSSSPIPPPPLQAENSSTAVALPKLMRRSRYVEGGIPKVSSSSLVERRTELLLQQQFDKSSSLKSWSRSCCYKRQLLNATGIPARKLQKLCKLNDVSPQGSISTMQQQLWLKGFEYYLDEADNIREHCLDSNTSRIVVL